MADEGASPRELLFEASRRNNTSLLDELLVPLSETAISALINDSRDALGLTALHVAAKYGAYDVLDVLLDQPMVETDPVVPSSAATPLHLAVEYTNELGGPAEWPAGQAIVDILLDAGCDPRLRNKERRKPVELADVRNRDMVDALRKAEMQLDAGADVVNEDDEGGDGPPSDSD